jgi:hypothetical protein
VQPASTDATAARTGLSARDIAILQLERRPWRHAGVKEEAVRRELGLSPARYYQLLNALIDRPEAVVHDPMLVGRLQRIRDARADARRIRTGPVRMVRRAADDD